MGPLPIVHLTHKYCKMVTGETTLWPVNLRSPKKDDSLSGFLKMYKLRHFDLQTKESQGSLPFLRSGLVKLTPGDNEAKTGHFSQLNIR